MVCEPRTADCCNALILPSAVPSEEAFSNPIPLDDEETVAAAERLREQLSTASQPVLASRQPSVLVNTSVFGRERGRSYTSQGFHRLDSLLPKQGKPG